MDDSPQNPDSLDRARTEGGTEPQASGLSSPPPPSGSQNSVGTAGKAESSLAGFDRFADAISDGSELVDLSARYEIQERLGKGGMGEVWRAKDRILQRAVAVKRIQGRLASSRQGVARFLIEARAIAALNHPNIVQVYDFGRDQQGYFLVMELVEGESLADRLHRCGPLETVAAIELGSAICDALVVAHASGIVHRDIKPGNILLNRAGVPKLGDFGLARFDDEEGQLTSTGAVLGTRDYMAPEQREGAHQADARSDIWSLAATLYQVLTGQVPRVIHADRLTETMREVLIKALEDEPTDRYQSAAEFAAALRAIGSAASTAPAIAPGKCPSCGRMNAADRRFCGSCGGSLEEPCLACGAQNGVWEQFCGKCGANLSEGIKHEAARIERQRQEALSLRAAYRYTDAIVLVESLSAIKHPRLAKQLTWVDGLLTQLHDEQHESEAARDRLYQAAGTAADEQRYQDAVRLLGQVPEPLRDERVHSLLGQVSASLGELKTLAAEINQAVKSKQYRGLLPKVERYRELRPRDERALQLENMLRGWESRHLPRAAPPPAESTVEVVDAELAPSPASEMLPVAGTQRPSRVAPAPIEPPLGAVDGPEPSSVAATSLHSTPNAVQDYLIRHGHIPDGYGAVIDGVTPPSAGTATPPACSRAGAAVRATGSRALKALAWTGGLRAVLGRANYFARMFVFVTFFGVVAYWGYVIYRNAYSRTLPPNALGNQEGVANEKTYPSQSSQANLPAVPPSPTPSAVASLPAEANSMGNAASAISQPATDLPTEINSISMQMVLIPAGEFMIEGHPDDNDYRHRRPYKVQCIQPFWLGMHEVTVSQFRKFVEDNKYNAGVGWQNAFPSQTDNHPVVMVSWDDANAFCEWLTKKEGKRYHLPTPAQWQYASHGGSKTHWYFGNDLDKMGDHAWSSENSDRQTHAVGQKKPSAWGLYDMYGNVTEWCESTRSPFDPPHSSGRTARGGSYAHFSSWAEEGFGGDGRPSVLTGFRVARAAE